MRYIRPGTKDSPISIENIPIEIGVNHSLLIAMAFYDPAAIFDALLENDYIQ
jgi:hypothetical protein